MGKKIFFLFTCLLFSAANAVAEDFSLEGGMTSDSLKIYGVKTTRLRKIPNQNTLLIDSNSTKSTLEFYVSVPEGKEAYLQCEVLLEVSSKTNDPRDLDRSSITYNINLNGENKVSHIGKTEISRIADKIDIPAGDANKITVEVIIKAKRCITAGSISNLSIHIHRFSEPEVLVEAECGKIGKSQTKCLVCGKSNTYTVMPAHAAHHLVMMSQKKGSCMSTANKVMKCEYCPHTEIHKSDESKYHKFDAAGKCTVCGLHLPKCNTDSTIFEINNAEEMRVLAELVSIGRIPGNIGININNDLEFSSDLPMEPLGTFDHPFQGVLNGNGRRIRGIVNYYQGVDGLGFVGVAKGTVLSHAVIANLIFDRGNTLGGSACVGSIVGHATYCDIVNCASFGALEGAHNVGGIVGYADQQVGIINCASVITIRTTGTWNNIACGMPLGHIYNSYGSATNDKGGKLDELPTTELRHCFSTQASAEELTLVTPEMLTTEDMVQALNEESETTIFDILEGNIYPVPLANTSIIANSNRAIPTRRSAGWRRVLSASSSNDDEGDPTSEKNDEVIVLSGYVDEDGPTKSGQTIEEIKHEEESLYADFNRVYIATRIAPENAQLYEPVSGGKLSAFESFLIPNDSAYICLREYDLVAPDLVKVVAESYNNLSDNFTNIDEYTVSDTGVRTLKSRISVDNNNYIVYKENVNGVLRKAWSIETEYDDLGNAAVTSAYSHNYTTGETRLEYSYEHNSEEDQIDSEGNVIREEYMDSLTNTIHIIYNYMDPATGEIISRDHYILRASDEFLLENRTEEMKNGKLCLVDGMYYIYDDEGNLVQSVSFGPVDPNDPNSEIRPNTYYDYTGEWPGSPFQTAIKVPTVEHQPSLQKRMDFNVYDMQGRMVRKAADVKDPFNGLPRGIYIYQGAKYLKK